MRTVLVPVFTAIVTVCACTTEEPSGSDVDSGRAPGDSGGPIDDGGGPPPGTDGGPVRDGSTPPSDAPAPSGAIAVSGRSLTVGGAPYEIRGVCWHPVARGESPPPDYARFADEDIALMQAAGINTVRTYTAIRDRSVLDRLHAAGIRVIEMVYAWGGADPEEALTIVREERDHPAILMWALGNEWNYNGLYTGVPFDEARARLEAIAARIQEIDPDHPVATVYGEVPSPETIAAMPSVDVWGLNVYRGIQFYDLFDVWASRSGAPMFLGEYGADAYDARAGGGPNAAAQAEATRALTMEWMARSVARHEGGVTLGGTLFEWSDEWWKDGSGSPDVHDVGGVAPGGGPHPDMTFNEEWWGVVEVDRTTRPAYDVLRELYGG